MVEPRSYSDVVVNKPWGSEYLVFSNSHAALWHLRIHAGCQTSLHCHPRKKTGLILLTGSASIQFLNNRSVLKSPANTMIRPGLFHSTSADQGTDLDVLELESPVDKTDIVRLEDPYGRANTPYEGWEHTTPLDHSCLRLPSEIPPGEHFFDFCSRKLCLFRFDEIASRWDERPAGDIVVVLEGGLFSKDGDPVLTAGDAVSTATVRRLARAFASPFGIAGLWISHVS
jgi:mannose-6-phosphate isomerase-like protein (cupin superfamily)